VQNTCRRAAQQAPPPAVGGYGITASKPRPTGLPSYRFSIHSAHTCVQLRLAAMDGTSGLLRVLSVAVGVSSAFVTFVQDAEHAPTDRKLLAEEAHALSAILRRLMQRVQSRSSDEWLNDQKALVSQFERAYVDFAAFLKIDPSTGQLKQESRLKAICTSAKWAFSKSEVYSLLERINRLQQYADSLLLSDQASVSYGNPTCLKLSSRMVCYIVR
jgi:hypothetical protein